MCHIYGEVASRLPRSPGALATRQSPRSVAARLRVVLVVSPCSTPSAFPASARTRAAAPAHCHRQRSSALSLQCSLRLSLGSWPRDGVWPLPLVAVARMGRSVGCVREKDKHAAAGERERRCCARAARTHSCVFSTFISRPEIHEP